MATAAALITAEEYAELSDIGRPTELVRGRVVPGNFPFPRHGQICAQAAYLLGRYLDDHDLGHLIGNNSGIITERGPDTVRGADLAYYSYERVPRGPMPCRSLDVVPELVVEVRSHTDRWAEILAKVGEYLNAGVAAVCVLDEQTQTADVYRDAEAAERYAADQELTFPDVLPDFRVLVRRFFE